jgi:heme/copper-type cytochrome/quinol oxidase subunit 1
VPRLTIWMLRSALVYLAAGFTFGGLLLFHKGVPLHPALWRLLPAHIEFLLIGWTVQLVMGMAFWILPRFSRAPRRGNVPLAWLAFILLNLGVWLAGLGPAFTASAVLPFLGRLAELSAAGAFVLYAWPRVKAAGV